MKKYILYILLILAGSLIGYCVGITGGYIGWDLFWEICWGASVGYSISFAFTEKIYGMLVGAVIGLLVIFAIDWIAGSEVDVRNKLVYVGICSFIGWAFWMYWKPVLIGGGIGILVGFVLGLSYSHLFGKVCLPPGLLNAALSSVRIAMAGMGLASLFMKSFGYRYQILISHPKVR